MMKSDVRKFFLFIIVFIIFLLASISPVYSQWTISLNPMLVPVELSPGDKVAVSFMLINESTTAKPAQFKVYPSDVIEDRSGSYKPIKKGPSSYSAANWITIEESSQFELGPMEGREILAIISVPRGVYGGKYAAVVFELIPEEAPLGERLGGTVFSQQLVSVIEITITGRKVTPKAHISSLEVKSTGEDPEYREQYGENGLIFSGSLTNDGNIHVFGKGSLIIRDSTGRRRITEIPLGGGRGTVLPESTVDFVSIMRKQLPPGNYIAEARIKYGGLRPGVAKVPFTVTEKEVTGAKPGTGKVVNFISDPEMVNIQGIGGALRTSKITVSSQEEAPIKVKGSVSILSFDTEGEVEASELEESSWSCAGWVTLKPAEFELAPGKKQVVVVTVNIPKDVSAGGKYANVVFEAQSTAKGTTPVVAETGSVVMVSVGKDFQTAGEIVKVYPGMIPNTGAQAIIATFKNKGNIHVTPKGVAVFKMKTLPAVTPKKGETYVGEPTYEEVSRVNFEEVTSFVLPEGLRDLRVPLPENLAPGEYLVEVAVSYGGKTSAVSTFTFTINPTPTPVAEGTPSAKTPTGGDARKVNIFSVGVGFIRPAEVNVGAAFMTHVFKRA